MAFIFDPNPNEGDKQTNPDTGVEYIYTSGAWRALGAKIEDQFDVLDERYVQAEGDHMTGNLHLDTGSGLFSKEIIKSTRASGYAFQCRPSDGDTTLFLHTNGSFKLQGGEFNNDVTFNTNVVIGGGLSFPNGGQINVSSVGTVLSGRASLDIKTAADYPVVMSSGSSYKKLLAFYGYDGSQDDNRGETAYINANGNAYFKTVYANDEELATQTYVDTQTRGNGMRWKAASHNTAANLTQGEFFVAPENGNIYLHPKSFDGIDLGVKTDAIGEDGLKLLASVYSPSGNSQYFITFNKINFNNSSNRYIRVEKLHVHLAANIIAGTIYRLNIPGFTV